MSRLGAGPKDPPVGRAGAEVVAGTVFIGIGSEVSGLGSECPQRETPAFPGGFYAVFFIAMKSCQRWYEPSMRQAGCAARAGHAQWRQCILSGRRIYPRCCPVFEVLNGGALAAGYRLTLKATSGCVPRACSTRAMKKREAMTREEGAFYTSFPNLANCEQQTGAEYNLSLIHI